MLQISSFNRRCKRSTFSIHWRTWKSNRVEQVL